MAKISFIYRDVKTVSRLSGEIHAGGFNYGSVTPAARRADCTVTQETPKVRVLPGPSCAREMCVHYIAPVSQQEEGAGLNPVQWEFESLRENLNASVAELVYAAG